MGYHKNTPTTPALPTEVAEPEWPEDVTPMPYVPLQQRDRSLVYFVACAACYALGLVTGIVVGL